MRMKSITVLTVLSLLATIAVSESSTAPVAKPPADQWRAPSWRRAEDDQMLREIKAILDRHRTREHRAASAGVSVLPIRKNHHHDHEEVEAILRELSERRCPSIMKLHSAGQSLLGQEMWYVEISDNVGVNEPGEPEFRYVGNMHGNEVVGRELCLWIAEYICDEYTASVEGKSRSADDEDENGESMAGLIRWLVEHTHIYIMPSMNPDGYAMEQRENAHYIDLNRNFPDQFSVDLHQQRRAVEVEHMMRWSRERSFVLSANFHGGAIVANYPWDGNRDHRSGKYSATPDDRIFRALALSYAIHNRDMVQSKRFRDGITNGAEWYTLYGGYQDWTYLERGDMQLTIELSEQKWPEYGDRNHHGTHDPYDTLAYYWETNRKSVFHYMSMVHRGIKGFVLDPQGAPVRNAIVRVYEQIQGGHGSPSYAHRLMDVFVDPEHGDYYRILMPGSYEVEVLADGYESSAPRLHIDVDEPPRFEHHLYMHHSGSTYRHYEAQVHNFTLVPTA